MRRRRRSVSRAAVILVAALAAGLSLPPFPHPAGAQHAHHQHHAVGVQPVQTPFVQGLRTAMDRMHVGMAEPTLTGDADRDFLATMIPHHEGAVEMARLVLIHGRDALVRRLAEEIIAAQQSEIAAMHARLDILSRGADPQPGGFPALGGTRGAP